MIGNSGQSSFFHSVIRAQKNTVCIVMKYAKLEKVAADENLHHLVKKNLLTYFGPRNILSQKVEFTFQDSVSFIYVYTSGYLKNKLLLRTT